VGNAWLASLRWHDPDQVRGSALVRPLSPVRDSPANVFNDHSTRRAHGMVKRSISVTAPNSASASAASTTTAAPTSGASYWAVPSRIASPSPEPEPAYSAKRAATAAYEAATRMPVKIDGSAHGSSTRRKI